MTKFLALIEVLNQVGGGGEPTHPIAPGGPPPGIWPDPGKPTHPIAPGGPPPQPGHPIVIPPDSIAPGVPSHPIYIPSPPVQPEHPIVIPPDSVAPGVPSHPIVIPPEIWGPTDPRPDQGLPGPQPSPEHPIVLPKPPEVEEGDKALVLIVTKDSGPVWFIITADEELKPPTHPTPKNGSKSQGQGGTRQRK
jgi:hypothetical protein